MLVRATLFTSVRCRNQSEKRWRGWNIAIHTFENSRIFFPFVFPLLCPSLSLMVICSWTKILMLILSCVLYLMSIKILKHLRNKMRDHIGYITRDVKLYCAYIFWAYVCLFVCTQVMSLMFTYFKWSMSFCLGVYLTFLY